MRPTRVGIAGIVLLLLGVAAISAWRPQSTPKSVRMYQQADEWARNNVAALPRDFPSYATLTMPQRKAAYQLLSWPERKELWQRHVETFLLPAESLTTIQRQVRAALPGPMRPAETALLRVWLDSVVARAYEPQLTNTQRIAIARPLCEKAKTVLGKQKGLLILGQIGPTDNAWTDLLRSEASVRRSRASIFPTAAADALLRRGLTKLGLYRSSEFCSCNVSSWCDCGVDLYCTNSNCIRLGTGCGCGHFWACDGSDCAAT